MHTYGLIPAAGKSQRMGQPKLLMPIAGVPVLSHVLRAVRAGGVTDTLVVVAPDAGVLAEIAATCGAHVLKLERDTPDMRATCLHGLDWLETRFHPADADGWLLLPADHPTVQPDVVRALPAAAEANPHSSIFVPTYANRRGHPAWIRWAHVNELRTLPAKRGLNAFIRAWAAETMELPWPSDDVLLDLDTPEDYERMAIRIGK